VGATGARLAVVWLAVLALSAPAAAASGSISGTVTDTATHAGIANLEVCAVQVPYDGTAWPCTYTDDVGDYNLGSLDYDAYEVEFAGRPLGYVPMWWEGRESWGEGDPVPVEGAAVSSIDAELTFGGTIEGMVTRASNGSPLVGIGVCASDPVADKFGGCATTDSIGAYAIRGMPVGEYALLFSPGGEELQGEFYDGKDSEATADLVAVVLGGVRSGIDATLEEGGRIAGTVRLADGGAPVEGVEVCARSTTEVGYCTQSDGDGRYELTNVRAGFYKVEFLPAGLGLGLMKQFWDHRPARGEADGLTLEPGVNLTGIDADLMAVPTATFPPPVLPAGSSPAIAPRVSGPRLKRCKKGFHRKWVKGKKRCVRKHRRHAQR